MAHHKVKKIRKTVRRTARTLFDAVMSADFEFEGAYDMKHAVVGHKDEWSSFTACTLDGIELMVTVRTKKEGE